MGHPAAGTHFRGPLSGGTGAGDGLWEGVSIGALQPEDWALHINEFRPHESLDRAGTAEGAGVDFVTNNIGVTGGTWTVSGNSPGDVGMTVIQPDAQNEGLIIRTAPIYIAMQTGTGQAVEKELAWSCRFKVEDLTNQHFYVGLAEAEPPDVMDANGDLGAVNRAGFHHTDADGTSIDLVTRFNGGLEITTSAAFTMTDDRFVTVGIRVFDNPNRTNNASTVSYYVKPNGRVSRTRRNYSWQHLVTHTSGADNFSGNLLAQFANVSSDTGFANDLLWLDYFIWAHTRDIES